MKHNAFIGIAAVLCIASALLTSCREDTTVSSQITGYWYYENESPGTFDIGDSTVAYDKDINASNWRKQAGLYIFGGTSRSPDATQGLTRLS